MKSGEAAYRQEAVVRVEAQLTIRHAEAKGRQVLDHQQWRIRLLREEPTAVELGRRGAEEIVHFRQGVSHHHDFRAEEGGFGDLRVESEECG